jgi:YidC/Oxa1 family membrane protein insertase
MDRNQVTGLILMVVFVVVYFTWFSPDPPKPQPKPDPQTIAANDSVAQKAPQVEVVPDSAEVASQNSSAYGMFWKGAYGEEGFETLENEDLRITFARKGATVHAVQLLKYTDWKGETLDLVVPGKNHNFLFVEHQGRVIDLRELKYTPSIKKDSDTTYLTFSLPLEGASIRITYSLPASGYLVGMKIETTGLAGKIGEKITYAWTQDYHRVELDITDARTRSTVRYRTTNGDIDYISPTATSAKDETVSEPVKWFAFKQKFFTSAIIAENQFNTGFIGTRPLDNDSSSYKTGTMQATIPYQDFVAGTSAFTYYFGPTDYYTMKAVGYDMEENVNYGRSVLGWINTYFILYIFKFLESFIGNYGVIIIIMVLIVRLILSPLTYKSHMSMAKMRVLKPELDEIKEKHNGDMQKMQQEQMALYQKVGINPLSGCIPMLLQMPILFSLFYFFPNSIELRQQGFLWADDLSTYDNIMNLPFSIPMYGSHVSLFTLLMTISTILYTWSQAQISTITGPMKTLQYIMPVMFLFFLNSYSSGLTFYYFISNMSTFGQTFLFRRFVDEDKIRQILEENRKKNANKKKSGFALRLEEAMKASQKAQKKKKKDGKK